MKNFVLILNGILLLFISCKSPKMMSKSLLQTEGLKITKLTNNTYLHISYLESPTFGHVPCNGMIYVNGKEAAIFDTPPNDSVSYELIKWVEKELDCTVKAIVVNHFHGDCLGGLKAFHEKGIKSYANNETLILAKKDNKEIPQNGFDASFELKIGNEKVINTFFGAGHTYDNIVSYVPEDNVLFGGCMIKEVGAGKGFIGDANLNEWSNTVEKVKKAYPNLKVVIPGHGKTGGVELLDFTKNLFKVKAN